jgi:dihydrolipoamide dehydrogenase
MGRYEVDLAVIGGGPGGYVAAIRAGQLGMKVALIEKENVGGICLNWGCIPSKALLRSAEIIRIIERAAEFGVSVDGIRTDMGQAVRRSRQVVDRMVKGVEFLLEKNGVQVLQGEGYLRSATEIEVRGSGDSVVARNTIIATGARSRSLPGIEIDGETVITSREALLLAEPPSSIVIVGGGPVGVEFAYYYRAFGSAVTIVEMLPRLVPNEDEDVSRLLERAFKQQGIGIMTGTRVEGMEQRDGGWHIRVVTPQGTDTVPAERVLLGVGVQPNSDGMGLEELGVAMERGFIQIDEHMATNVPGIYAIGDVTGKLALAHVASAQGVTAVEAIAGLEPPSLSYDDMPRATYCQPQVASIGLTEAQARARGYEVKVARFPLRGNGKALALGEAEGFAKIVADARYGDILGCHLIGPEVTELISEVSLARVLEATPNEVGLTVHPHPTLSEAVKEAALAIKGEAVHFWFGDARGG